MKLSDFESRFEEYWREQNGETTEGDWLAVRRDTRRRRLLHDELIAYAADIRKVGCSRPARNKPRRIFQEMGVDAREIDIGPEFAATAPRERRPAQLDAGEMPATRGRVMYIERKAGRMIGEARIGRVVPSKSGRTLYYGGRSFRSLKGGYKANYCCVETGETYWISGCKRDGGDRLYRERLPIIIDDDAAEEYWVHIRRRPEHVTGRSI